MKKLEKPKFFTTPILDTSFMFFGTITTFSFRKNLSDIHLIYIILLLFLIVFSWNLAKYIYNWHKFYKKYLTFYEKFEELENRYNMRIDEIRNKELLINEYDKFIERLNIFITTALTNNSDKETQQLQNMQNLLFMSVEHLIKMKGE